MAVPNSAMLPPITDVGLIYPDSDGEPLGETDFRIAAIILLREGLQDFFRDQAKVYVASDLFLYYGGGKPSGAKGSGCDGGQRRRQALSTLVQNLGREGDPAHDH